MSKTDSVPSTITMMTKPYSTIKMHLFVLIQRFNNYLPSELDLGYNNKKNHQTKIQKQVHKLPLICKCYLITKF